MDIEWRDGHDEYVGYEEVEDAGGVWGIQLETHTSMTFRPDFLVHCHWYLTIRRAGLRVCAKIKDVLPALNGDIELCACGRYDSKLTVIPWRDTENLTEGCDIQIDGTLWTVPLPVGRVVVAGLMNAARLTLGVLHVDWDAEFRVDS